MKSYTRVSVWSIDAFLLRNVSTIFRNFRQVIVLKWGIYYVYLLTLYSWCTSLLFEHIHTYTIKTCRIHVEFTICYDRNVEWIYQNKMLNDPHFYNIHTRNPSSHNNCSRTKNHILCDLIAHAHIFGTE